MVRRKSQNNEQDRRSRYRVRVDLAAWYRDQGGAFKRLRLADLGTEGAQVAAADQLEVGSNIDVTVRLEGGRYLSLRGTVRWQGWPVAGIQFEHSADAERLGNWLRCSPRAAMADESHRLARLA